MGDTQAKMDKDSRIASLIRQTAAEFVQRANEHLDRISASGSGKSLDGRLIQSHEQDT